MLFTSGTMTYEVDDVNDEVKRLVADLKEFAVVLSSPEIYKTLDDLRVMDIETCESVAKLIVIFNERLEKLRQAIFTYFNDFDKLKLKSFGRIYGKDHTLTELAKKHAKKLATDPVSCVAKEISYPSFKDTEANKAKYIKLCNDGAEMLHKLDIEVFRQSESIAIFCDMMAGMPLSDLVDIAKTWNHSPVEDLA